MADYDRSRIERLRANAVKPVISYSEFYDFFNAHFREHPWNTFACRYAEAQRYAYENWTPSIEPGERIVGRPAFREHSPEEAERFRLGNEAAAFGHCSVGQDSHMAIDYPRLLSLGTSGIAALIREKQASLDPMEPESVKKDDFYRSCLTVLVGVEALSRHYAERAEELAEQESDPAQAAEYREIASVCRRVPQNPASTFREAVQSTAFMSYALSVKPLRPSMLQFQLGRPDRYLLPYYEADRAAGILSDEEAQTFLDELCIQINRRVPNGLSSGFMVGGRCADGTVVSNPLTRMFLCAIEQVHLVYPSVGLCCTSDTPEEDLNLGLRILSGGHSHPALFNDDVIQRGLRHYGLPPEEACEYIHSTCVEITPVGSSNVWVASPYMNLPAELMTVLDGDPVSFEELTEQYRAHLRRRIAENCRNEVRSRWERAKYLCDPLTSCFVKDCLESGVDIEEGGARYNWIMPSFVGVSNTADALYAIRELVFRRKELTLAEWKRAMAANYASDPALLATIRALPKYGNDNRAPDSPDALVNELSTYIADVCEEFRVPFGGRLIPSLFCWIMHDQFGQQTGATPDGRLAGFPLGDGSGPAQGRESEGPTASILSSTSWDHHRFIGGIAVNMKFSKSLFTDASLPLLSALVKTYLSRGGFELQINVVDQEVLEKAQKDPASYEDLVVRIGGYSDYFTRLSPTMQAEVIERTSHELC